MIGVYDFCGHYEWTFEWLRRLGGDDLVHSYWKDAIGGDSQRHAATLIRDQGFEGMKLYWGHTLQEEGAGYRTFAAETVFRIDMWDCPSKGFLIRNGLEQYRDYCDHCIGWIGPLLDDSGFTVDHEHNHCGQCWWEMRRKGDDAPASSPAALVGDDDIRLSPTWEEVETPIDVFLRGNSKKRKENK